MYLCSLGSASVAPNPFPKDFGIIPRKGQRLVNFTSDFTRRYSTLHSYQSLPLGQRKRGDIFIDTEKLYDKQ